MKHLLSNVLLIGLSLVVSVFAIEGICRYVYTRKLDYQIEMSRYAAMLKQRSEDPRVGHEHRPSARERLMGVDVSINSHGYRGGEYPQQKPDDEWRVVVLGDSLTFGWGVEGDDTFAHQLGLLLRDRFRREGRNAVPRAVNTGVGNYNTDQEVRAFENRGRDFAPDLVVLAYFINDAEETPQQRYPAFVKHSYLAMSLWGRLDLFLRVYLDGGDYARYYPDLYREEQAGWRRTREAFARLAGLARQDGFALAVVLLPELHEVGEVYGFHHIHEQVARAARAAGIEHVFDMAPRFSREPPEGLWVSLNDAHPNARAHRIIARGLYDELDRAGLLAP